MWHVLTFLYSFHYRMGRLVFRPWAVTLQVSPRKSRSLGRAMSAEFRSIQEVLNCNIYTKISRMTGISRSRMTRSSSSGEVILRFGGRSGICSSTNTDYPQLARLKGSRKRRSLGDRARLSELRSVDGSV